MEVVIKGHHIAVTEAMRAYVHERINRLKERLQGATHFSVLFAGSSKNGKAPSIQILVRLAGKKVLTIKELLDEAAMDFYVTMGKGFATLSTQLERHAGLYDKKHKVKRREVVLHHKQVVA